MKPQHKRRICCFCETWESGGIESFLYNVLLRVDLTRLEVDLVAAEIRESVFTAELQKRGIHFYELSGNQHNLLKNWWDFCQLLRKRKYDVAHFNVFQGLSLVYAQLAKAAGVSVRIVHSHNTALRQSRTRWIKIGIHQIARFLFSNAATRRWACSSDAAAFMFSRQILADAGFQFIPNGIEINRFRFQWNERERVRKTLGLTGAFVVGNVGRLCAQKNQMFLLDVFAEIYKLRPESQLLLVGTGDMEVILKEKAEKLGISPQVNFLGTSNHIPQLLWAMDLFVFPSLFEGLSVAVVEAQTAGLPVFCSESISEETHLTDRFQIVSLNKSSRYWAQVILANSNLWKNRERCADLVCEAGFEIEDVVRKIEAVYLGE